MISATWRGINTTRKRALLLQKAFPKMVEVASYAVAEKVQENAMDILNQNRQETSHLHGWPVIHIGDAWKTTERWNGSTFNLELRNISNHAAAVEFGTHTPITPKTEGHLLWLGDGIYKKWVRGQPGYHYLQGALNMTDDIINTYVKEFKDSLRMVLL